MKGVKEAKKGVRVDKKSLCLRQKKRSKIPTDLLKRPRVRARQDRSRKDGLKGREGE